MAGGSRLTSIAGARRLGALLRPGGSITVIEGDHGSALFHPDSRDARAAIASLVEVQRASGGDALIGRQLYPLLVAAGFDAVHVSPRMVYADASRPALVEGFTRKTFTAMIEGVRKSAIAAGLIDAERFDAGIRALYRTAEADGVFCYTFFKGVGEKGQEEAPRGAAPRRLTRGRRFLLSAAGSGSAARRSPPPWSRPAPGSGAPAGR